MNPCNKQVPCLRELVVADNMLGDDGAEDLAEGLKGHPCLGTLVRPAVALAAVLICLWQSLARGGTATVDLCRPLCSGRR